LTAILTERKRRLILTLIDFSGKVLLTRNIGPIPGSRRPARSGFDPDEGPTHPEGETDDDVKHGRHRSEGRVILAPDRSFVAVHVGREVRIYRILPEGARRRRVR
jgi:hypothetical protein